MSSKLFPLLVLAVLFSAFLLRHIHEEARYRLSGRQTTAQLTRAEDVEVSGAKGKKHRRLRIEYTFADDAGNSRTERQDLPPGWNIPEGGTAAPTIAIEYVPGKPGWSRVMGRNELFSIALFGGVAAVLAVIIAVVWLRNRNAPVSGEGMPEG